LLGVFSVWIIIATYYNSKVDFDSFHKINVDSIHCKKETAMLEPSMIVVLAFN